MPGCAAAIFRAADDPLDRFQEDVHGERLAEVLVDAEHFRVGLVPASLRWR